MRELLFWGMWLIIPLLVEVLGSVLSFIYLLFKSVKEKPELEYKDMVSILVPIYNSSTTIGDCIDSIANQTYGKDNIEVLLLNNGKLDNSYNIYVEKNKEYKEMNMYWVDTKPGKAKALNTGIFNSIGQYVINIDSDGVLEENAIENIIKKFKSDSEIKALTGVILTNYNQIGITDNKLLKLIQKAELFEYVESFLLGRNFTSLSGGIYTLAGAFSAFRKEVLTETFLYNHETVGEDTHMTFQLSYGNGNEKGKGKGKGKDKGKVQLCEDAIFFTEPIGSLNQLYTQRQRWQIGQLQVGKLFYKEHTGNILTMMFKRPIRVILASHTLAFPRLVWVFGITYLYLKGYPFKLIFISLVGMYILYVFSSFVGYITYIKYLKKFKSTQNYFKRNILVVLFLPIYRTIIYFFRIAGVINSRHFNIQWTSYTLTEEMNILLSSFNQFKDKYIEPIRLKISKIMEDDRYE